MTSSAAAGGEAGARLRVGLLLDSFAAPAWIERVVTRLRADVTVELALVVLDDSPGCAPRGVLSRALQHRHSLAYRLYARLDAARYARPDDALALRDLSESLARAPVRRVRPERTKDADRFPAEDIAAIRAHRLDVVLRLGFRSLRGDALRMARHGVWSLHAGDAEDSRNGPAAFWEVADAAPSAALTLVRVGEAPDGDRILARSWSFVDPRSMRCARSELFWKGAALFERTLRALGAGSVVALDAASGTGTARAPSEGRVDLPTNLETLGAVLRIGGRWLRDVLLRALFVEHWALAFSTDAGFPPAMQRFRQLLPPRDRIWADPFLFEHEGRCWLFIEECLLGAPRAHLAVMEMASDGPLETPRTVLERPYHLSYPFVFRWNDELWMLPETSGNRTVELYRCVEFPSHWELAKVLLDDVYACDATLHERDGRWWMFASMAVPGSQNFDELHVFHADTPLGPWRPLPANPVVSDVRRARPAGRLFLEDGRWIRPAQDGSGRYGRALRFQQVERLDVEGYAESDTGGIEPGWKRDVLGIHTWNIGGGLACIDFIKRRRRF